MHNRTDIQLTSRMIVEVWLYFKVYIEKCLVSTQCFSFPLSFCLSLSQKHTAAPSPQVPDYTLIHKVSIRQTHTCARTHTYKTLIQVEQCGRDFPPLPSYTRLFLWQQASVSGTENWKLTGSMSSLQGAGMGVVGGLGLWLRKVLAGKMPPGSVYDLNGYQFFPSPLSFFKPLIRSLLCYLFIRFPGLLSSFS